MLMLGLQRLARNLIDLLHLMRILRNRTRERTSPRLRAFLLMSIRNSAKVRFDED